MKTSRLFFIDAMRAFAILMMLQGHFIDALLDPVYRDPNNMIFRVWSYFRGITAPTFFTISGLIFTYLLLKARDKGDDKRRMKKGIYRGLMLIGIGYLLRIPVFDWIALKFTPYFLVTDVLQIIGLSLIVLVVLYQLCFRVCLLYGIVCFSIGICVFLTEPLYRDLRLENVPAFIANYLSKENGSIFTFLPWFGYMTFGASIAVSFYRHLHRNKFKLTMILTFIIVGYVFVNYSAHAANWLYNLTDIEMFKDISYYNYLFPRLGNVLLLFAFFYTFERFLKQSLIFKIGQKTLSIYVIHFIIIYGSFTGYGLYQIIGKTLTPWQAIFGALMFLSVVTLIALYRVKTNTFVYGKLKGILNRLQSKR
ncbi:heparan-alpha-glucosaminide N-acetyltransferase domain-containing protein [Ichthyenterobacterium sp. W332]|uniref:Heparan-alpha-glucosaminide N-acetyltransferase domain-containing protein n=1 Tax=Microcosmobacter mediterraneus TaxID=3075607 RepID=A0ABU2YKE4_9FLAO|nr:heparan-alpha-glucosaminide N-acetyltransferase domain-containing protein [Ichthyenterobacterium sp. W332]MDT0558639.1 heparan-alpha-glucosaminide N-acetyltransferase domain-containing protein [Ichthyenterobacterium sp. W332]